MAENSKIEWTDHTFNGWIGCTKVSPACDNCYAEATAAKRFGWATWGNGKPRYMTSDKYWRMPLAWNAKAEKEGTRPRVFANSLSDVFDAEVPDEWRDRLFALIALTPNLDWMVLTKRSKVALDYFTGNRKSANGVAMPPLWHIGMAVDQPDWHDIKDLPLPNLWLGTTVENQAMADLRIPLLLETPAAKRFLSCEPLLGPVDLCVSWHGECALNAECWGDCGWCKSGLPPLHNCRKYTSSFRDKSGLDLVIAGGESGPGARPSHPDWFRELRDQCEDAGVPFFFKQWGDWLPWEEDSAPFWVSQNGQKQDRHTLLPAAMEDDPKWNDGLVFAIEGEPHAVFQLVGKKAAGRLLDGREWSEMPT